MSDTSSLPTTTSSSTSHIGKSDSHAGGQTMGMILVISICLGLLLAFYMTMMYLVVRQRRRMAREGYQLSHYFHNANSNNPNDLDPEAKQQRIQEIEQHVRIWKWQGGGEDAGDADVDEHDDHDDDDNTSATTRSASDEEDQQEQHDHVEATASFTNAPLASSSSTHADNNNHDQDDDQPITSMEEGRTPLAAAALAAYSFDRNCTNSTTTAAGALQCLSDALLIGPSASACSSTFGRQRSLEKSECHEERKRPCCSICINAFQPQDVVCQSHNPKCNHTFHLTCLTQWLLFHDECPLCRERYSYILPPSQQQQQDVFRRESLAAAADEMVVVDVDDDHADHE